MSLRSVTLVLPPAEGAPEGAPSPRLRLLLRWRDLRRLEKDHGLKPEELIGACRELAHAPTILRVALEAGMGSAYSETQAEALLDEIPLLRMRHFLVATVIEAYGRLEPGDEEALGDGPKGQTASPAAAGSAPSPSPSE